ncbi:MAG: amidohydrolase family protein [Candidatus Rokubacteria bacterium]|nr:amidohydrolase family protein [Candidatus Rokubacteria bacterium]
MRKALAIFLAALAALVSVARPASAQYRGSIIDAHSHLPNPQALDAYVQAMARHNVRKVLLLGVGGVQKQDLEWIGAAARKYPDKVLPGAPVPDPLNPAEAKRLDALLANGRYAALGEVHIRQVSRKIQRKPDDPAFGSILEVAARHGLPVVIHAELDDETAERLERALKTRPTARLVLAHGGSADPKVLERLLERNPNLLADLSGMHFLRSPALATEAGPLDSRWKALIERLPDRFLMGIDVWAPQLFEPATLDRLMRWTRRILGELPPDVAEQVAHRNAARVFGLER